MHYYIKTVTIFISALDALRKVRMSGKFKRSAMIIKMRNTQPQFSMFMSTIYCMYIGKSSCLKVQMIDNMCGYRGFFKSSCFSFTLANVN